MTKKTLSRRDFVRLTTLGTAGILAACVSPAPQVIKQQVEVTRIVEVAGTPAPAAAPAAVMTMGFPRGQTVFAQQLTGRNATPTNFNYGPAGGSRIAACSRS